MRLTTQTSYSFFPFAVCPGTSLHVLLENKVNHHYVGGYYGAASEEEMKRELVSCRNLCQGSKVHKTVRNPHFWKVMLTSGGSWPLSKLHSAPS